MAASLAGNYPPNSGLPHPLQPLGPPAEAMPENGATWPLLEVQANILVVDDRPDKLLALQTALSPLGQNLVLAHSGKDALRRLLKQDFAVILLDVAMPVMDGFETAALIRQRANSEFTPIIFLASSNHSESHIARGYSLGAVDYLLTPIVPEILRAKAAVFIDLHRKTELVKRQAEQLRHDIQARREAEAQATRLNRELAQQVAALTEANRELEAFNYSIAHDLRTPLRSMNGFARALFEDESANLSPLGLEYATRIARSAKYMDNLLLDLLTYSRLALAEMPPAVVSLDEPVNEHLQLLESELRERSARVDVTSPLGKVFAHPATVKQILSNLVGNGLKFVAPGRTPALRIYTTRHPGFVRLWVEDNGIGIPPEHHEKVFRLFQRLHDSQAYPGTGIGLALVRKGAERMGGRAGVESEPGRGSRFWVDIPAAEGSGNGN